MAERAGTHWRDDELDAIVSNYFEMLTADLAKAPYSKTKQRNALIAQIGRSNGSVEYKHQNISAVLDELGMPWIAGYKPKPNYQNAIFDAIDRYLTERFHHLENAIPILPPLEAMASDVFVEMPILSPPDTPLPERLQRLVRKFDPVERDHRNRALGKAGEEFVLEVERRRLTFANRSDLARKIRWIADEDGDGAGYDVLSFDVTGRERLLEVKTTNGSKRTPFFLTRNEFDMAKERPEEWRIYRVHSFATGPHIFPITPPLESAVNLRAEIWKASF